MRIARRCGVKAFLTVPCLAAGMIAGADTLDDLDALRLDRRALSRAGLRL